MVGGKIYSLLIYRLLENVSSSPYGLIISPSMHPTPPLSIFPKSLHHEKRLGSSFWKKIPPYLREGQNMVKEGLHNESLYIYLQHF